MQDAKKKGCSQKDVALKAFFLGPQAENASDFLTHLSSITEFYLNWRKQQYPKDGLGVSNKDKKALSFQKSRRLLQSGIKKIAIEFQKEIPKFSPRYIGHMFSDLSEPGMLGHWLALLHNPNNISSEVSTVGVKIEKKAIQSLSKMIGWSSGTGHFTSGGSIANLEALLRMKKVLSRQVGERSLRKCKLITSAAAHYSWKKSLSIVGFNEDNLEYISLDQNGQMDLAILKSKLEKLKVPILGVVSLFGSTEFGTIDNIFEIQRILDSTKRAKIWHHVDAAYGGFFACTRTKKINTYLDRQIEGLKRVDSVTLDPHKLGYVPYGCGAFICRKPSSYYYEYLDAPYINFSSNSDAGVQTIEGSRPATGATAILLTGQTMGFHANGFGRLLMRQIKTANHLKEVLAKCIPQIIFPNGLDLNIVCFTIKTQSKKISDSNRLVETIYEELPRSEQSYYVAKTKMNFKKHSWLRASFQQKEGMILDHDEVEFIRMTIMNPFFLTKETKILFAHELSSAIKKLAETCVE